jgi:putative copper export protein
VHHLVVRPLVERGDGRIARVLSRSLLGEATVVMAVLLAAAILVDSKPPPQPEPAPVQANAVSLRP